MSDLLKEAIADAKAVRETALLNAKAALEEAFTPQLKNMLSAKLKEDEFEDEEIPAEVPAEEGYYEDDQIPGEEPAVDEDVEAAIAVSICPLLTASLSSVPVVRLRILSPTVTAPLVCIAPFTKNGLE